MFTRKGELERLIDSVGESLNDLSAGLTKSRLLKGGLIAGAVAGLTAASAGISSLRRRSESRDS